MTHHDSASTNVAPADTAKKLDLHHFRQEGYVIIDVLSPDELDRLRAAADALMRREPFASDLRFHYVPLISPNIVAPALLGALDHPVLLAAVSTILEANGCGSGPLVMDNAALLAAEPGVSYIQGWHRDVLQIPEDQITDELFSPRWRHNNVQLNLALADDAAFWAVPGSHHRPDTTGERQAFGGTKHMSPLEVVMPGSRSLSLKAGQAALYNNNLIHRGTCDFKTPRRTLHFGYHSAQCPPSWHFYNSQDTTVTPAYLASLPPHARRWVEGRLARRQQFPDIKASYRAGFV